MNKLVVVLLMFPMVVMGQEAPYECDNNYGECGTPEMSGGGNAGGSGSILINNTDLGDTYQSADDYDDDGVEDSYDNCPRQPNREQFDSDGDGVGDLCDNCRNTHNINQWNIDGDDFGDLCDSDIDNDDVPNTSDNCLRISNKSQDDLDNDSLGDPCDPDMDGDGQNNLEDDCPTIPGQDGQFYAQHICFPDSDEDTVPDFGEAADNCISVYNPEQIDTDSDGAGDACDPDLDSDGVLNKRDNCPNLFNVDQADEDRDQIGDACDNEYCFVIFGDYENCLDPEGPFKVYSPDITLNVGQFAKLKMFVNRQESEIRYTWSVKKRPPNSRKTIANPSGRSSSASLYEYIMTPQPQFLPDVEGIYIFTLHAKVIFEDEDSSEIEVADQHDIVFHVSDVKTSNAAGCNSSTHSNFNFSIVVMVMCFVLFQGILRRRNRKGV